MKRSLAPRGAYALDRAGRLCDVIEVVHDNPLQTYLLLPLDEHGLPQRGEQPAWVPWGEVVAFFRSQSDLDTENESRQRYVVSRERVLDDERDGETDGYPVRCLGARR